VGFIVSPREAASVAQAARASTVAVDGTWHIADAAGGVAVQATDDHDAGVVRLIAVVEDEVVAESADF
jgi:hypothetical protein